MDKIYVFLLHNGQKYHQSKKYMNNFASKYGGASIIEKHEKILTSKNVLDDNLDTYMMSEC